MSQTSKSVVEFTPQLAEAHDRKAHLWNDLHQCHAIVSVSCKALAYEDSQGLSDYFSALELVEQKLMKAINTLDDLGTIDFMKASKN